MNLRLSYSSHKIHILVAAIGLGNKSKGSCSESKVTLSVTVSDSLVRVELRGHC